MNEQATHFDIVAKTQFGLEELLAAELRALGATDIELLTRAVKYKGDKAILYKSNLHLRTALKVLMPFASFYAHHENQLYKRVRQIDWSQYLTPKQTLAIDATTNSDIFHHSKFTALKTKDAIVDQFRDRFGVRPSVDVESPDFRLNVHIHDKLVTLSMDSSGGTLDRRGYRLSRTEAPMNEVLAAGIVMLSGWTGEGYLLDPMCGSGTFGIEAAMLAANIAPGKKRLFGFERWKDFEGELWSKIKTEAVQAERNYPGQVICSDLDAHAIEISEQNAKRAGVDRKIIYRQADFFESKPPGDSGIVLFNPPYGERLETDDIVGHYREIGNQLKHHYAGHTAWIISANAEALKHVGLRPTRKIKLFNGALECRLQKFEMFAGKKYEGLENEGELKKE
ncbi:MAG: methyltransferase [Saprospiraceae bacterium]|nr:methyltransferase [Saprospiraceae bacterium]MCF8250491.1 methyltransferase [Saprospiraceae bacterium]MCF8281996.1 methyltransferase [Bacteroidales bacterium]MCF8312363.1 methyltransferase [Saprospiraceae bacterium]MCF8440640.1 methyltransferase [Saprospiraceae bacterium]